MGAGRRSHYTEEDRAVVYASLVANNWNVKRTSRETSFPEQTVRNWAKSWKAGDRKPAAGAVDAAVSNFLTDATRMRDKMLLSLESDLEAGKMKPGEKITAMGVLDDKIARAQGLLRKGDTNVHVHLPSADDLLSGLVRLVETAQHGVAMRHADIVDAEIIEQPRALPR